MKKIIKLSGLLFLLLLVSTAMIRANGADWRTADRSSAGIAPLPEEHEEAVIQVYGARTYGWRGVIAVHTWIATKEKGAANYRVHQVVGWRQRRNLPVVVSDYEIPDRYWFGNTPDVYADLRGAEAEAIFDEVIAAIKDYPYDNEYTMWPGPNSNTFTAFVGRQVPQLKLDLPPTAIGKDYLGGAKLLGRTPSGGGGQISLFGVLGILISAEEGLEVNVLSLNFGINPMKLNLRLPGFGNVGADLSN